MDQLRAPLAAEDLGRAVRDDLVRVRVRRGARACLVDVDRKLVVELAIDDLLRRRRARRRGSSPSSRLVWAAARLTMPRARMNRRGMAWSEIGKFRTARWVEAP